MASRQIIRTFLFLVVIASLVLAGCAQPPAPAAETEAPAEATEAPAAEATEAPAAEATEPPVEATEAPAAEEPAEGDRQVATFIFTQEFDSLSPAYTNMWFSSITQQIWNCWAWAFDEKNALVPVLVTEIPSVENGGISSDGKTITLKLRDDITWHDGTPITSADFKFTFDMYMSDANAVNSRAPYDLVTSVETPDEQTVEVTFTEPYAPWAPRLFVGLLPQHVLQPEFDANGTLDTAAWNKEPTVGCGPFKFSEWESGSFARFEAYDDYWLGRPAIDEIFIRFVPDDASQIAALKAGEGDLGTFFAYSDLPELEAAGIEIISVFSGYNEGWYFNLGENGHPALKDEKVRQAMAYAFDRQKLVDDLLLGRTKPAATMWDNTPWVDPTIEPYPFDPEKAKSLLDEAGWIDSNDDGTRDKDGEELVLGFGSTTREIRVDTQAVVQQAFMDVGIGLDLQTFDSDIFFAGYGENGPAATGALDFYQYSTVTAFPDPDSADFRCAEIPSDENPAGTNWSAICDQELEDLFALSTTQVDVAERTATFNQITRLIFDKVYWLGVWQDPDLYGISSRIQNVKLSGGSPFFNIHEWAIAQ